MFAIVYIAFITAMIMAYLISTLLLILVIIIMRHTVPLTSIVDIWYLLFGNMKLKRWLQFSGFNNNKY